MVADGMVGYKGGEVASQLAVKTMSEAFRAKTFDGEHRVADVGRRELPRRRVCVTLRSPSRTAFVQCVPDSIKLAKDDKGQHHYIPMKWVTSVDDKVHIDRPGGQAMKEWSDAPASSKG